ncbi:MAG: hypothetical protein HGB10_07295 [Coriobacteriia bacterium]|nr:hypothetical protein [Coriobacteriia bacterium]
MRIQDDLRGFRSLLDDFDTAGFETPEDVRGIFAAFDAIPTAAALVDAATDSLVMALHQDAAAALEAALTLHQLRVGNFNDTRDRAESLAYREASAAYPIRETFSHLSTRYNSVAQSLHDAVGVVDPNTDPNAIDADSLAAWQSVVPIAEELEAVSELMIAAFEISVGDHAVHLNPLAVLALCARQADDGCSDAVDIWSRPRVAVDDAPRPRGVGMGASGAPRPRAYRGGKWTALIAAGVTLSAPATVDDYSPWVIPTEEAPEPDPAGGILA